MNIHTIATTIFTATVFAAQLAACTVPMDEGNSADVSSAVSTGSAPMASGSCDRNQDVCFVPVAGTTDTTIGHCAHGGDVPVCCTGCIDAQGVCQQGTSEGTCGKGGNACDECAGVLQNDALTCLQSACIAAECVWTAALAGTPCKVDMESGYTCNGNGACEDTDEQCKTTADCDAPPECHQTRCNDTKGPRHGKCDVFAFTDGEACTLGVCAVVTAGYGANLCKATNEKSLAYLCDGKSGPALGIGVCSQPDSVGYPDTWCCDLVK